MKGKKYGIIVSVITMVISLILILLVNWYGKENCELLSNILIGVLGSSIVTLIISISDYIVAKREALEDYYSQVYKIIIAFGKIKYFHITDRTLESAKCRDRANVERCLGAERTQVDITSEQIEKDCADIEKAMNYYLEFENLSYEAVENAFGRISFLFDKSEKHPYEEKHFRVWIYRNLHEKLRNMIKTIRLENVHFKAYKEGESNNIFVAAQKIAQLNEELFEIKKEDFEDEVVEKVYKRFFDDMYSTLEKFRARIYNCEEQKQMIVPVYTIRILKDKNEGSEA